MKLYLASEGIKKQLGSDFLELVGKSASDIKFAYITNAGDPYPLEKRGRMDHVSGEFWDLGLKPTQIDLKNYTDPQDILKSLGGYDVIWCGGGNTWYLRWLMKKSGFDIAIRQLLEKGVVYGGDSAGAIVATPTLKYVDLIDDPNDAPDLIKEGLGLVSFTIVPHWGYEKYARLLTKMRDGLRGEGYHVKTLTDQQAIIIDGDKVRTI